MLAIIGGTGLYALDSLNVVHAHDVTTPFGTPSSPILEARYDEHTLFFLARHGRHHQFLPHEVNYRANIYALKTLKVQQILGVSAVGSLREAIAPGHFAVASQYIDLVKDRVKRPSSAAAWAPISRPPNPYARTSAPGLPARSSPAGTAATGM